MDVGGRIQKLLNRTPNEVIAYRENNLDTPIARARYDLSQQRYVIVETDSGDERPGDEGIF